MKSLLVLLTLVSLLSGCTRYVKGDKMDLSIKRAPQCQVSVKIDGSLILEATAKSPCRGD